MLLQIIAITPAERAPTQIEGIHGLLGARLSENGVLQAERLSEQLKYRKIPVGVEFASGFVSCTETARIVAQLEDDLDVHPIEGDFENAPQGEQYATLFGQLGYAPLCTYLARDESLLALGKESWKSLHDHLDMVHVNGALVVMPPGLLQATMISIVPESEHHLLREFPVGPCEGFQILYNSKGMIVHTEPLTQAA